MAGKASATPRGKNLKAPANGRTTPAETAESAPHPNGAPTEDTIRAQAYFLWEAAGRPDSDGVEFWLRAELELRRAK